MTVNKHFIRKTPLCLFEVSLNELQLPRGAMDSYRHLLECYSTCLSEQCIQVPGMLVPAGADKFSPPVLHWLESKGHGRVMSSCSLNHS